jgi:hypothetical protein
MAMAEGSEGELEPGCAEGCEGERRSSAGEESFIWYVCFVLYVGCVGCVWCVRCVLCVCCVCCMCGMRVCVVCVVCGKAQHVLLRLGMWEYHRLFAASTLQPTRAATVVPTQEVNSLHGLL